MIQAGILGASGYTGAKLAFYLSRHPETEIAFATSRKAKGTVLSDMYGHLKGMCDIVFSDPQDVKDMDIDVLFTCAPDQTSMRVVPEYYERGIRIIDLAGDFLVMAATLMEIKSVMLLPKTETDEDIDSDIDDPRAELIRQLLEYKKFKDAANILKDSAEERKTRFTRPDLIIAELKSDEEPELDIEQVSIWTLLEAFDVIMQATGNHANFDHIKDDTPIDLYQIELLHRLQSEGPMTLEDICKNRKSRLVLVGLFLALLELIRSQLIHIEQTEKLGPIYIRSLTDEPAEQAVQNAIYASEDFEQTAELKTDETNQPESEPEQSITPPSEEPAAQAPIPIKELPPMKTTKTETAFDPDETHSEQQSSS